VDAGPVPLVLDLGGADEAADVAVVRPDATGLVAAAQSLGTLVVNGRGAVDLPRLRAAAQGRSVLATPWSARVAAAAVSGRMPADLPGSWLRPLSGLVQDPATVGAGP
jgi:hypothetical protein